MKRIFSLLICAVVVFSASLAAYAESPFAALQSEPEVTRVYISKAMMRMGMRQLKNMSQQQLRSSLPLGPSTVIDDMEIYSCESKKSAAKAESLFDSYLRNSKFEELLTVFEDDEKTYICGVPGDKEGFYKTVLFFVSEEDECNIIIMNGQIEFGPNEG